MLELQEVAGRWSVVVSQSFTMHAFARELRVLGRRPTTKGQRLSMESF